MKVFKQSAIIREGSLWVNEKERINDLLIDAHEGKIHFKDAQKRQAWFAQMRFMYAKAKYFIALSKVRLKAGSFRKDHTVHREWKEVCIARRNVESVMAPVFRED